MPSWPARTDRVGGAWRRLEGAVTALAGPARRAWRGLWPVARTALLRTAEVVLALVLLFEEWGWRPLAAALARLARFRPWAMLEAAIAGLPPYGALLVFGLPSGLLLPLKLLALWLVAHGHALFAGALFIGAKVVGTALVARLFLLTRPALMRIGWFARLHDWIVPWQEAMFAWVRASWAWRYGRMLKARARHDARRAWAHWRPRLEGWWTQMRPRLRRLIAQARRGARQTWRRARARYVANSSRR